MMSQIENELIKVNQKWNQEYFVKSEEKRIIKLEQTTLEGLQYLTNDHVPLKHTNSKGIHLQLIPSKYLKASIQLMT